MAQKPDGKKPTKAAAKKPATKPVRKRTRKVAAKSKAGASSDGPPKDTRFKPGQSGNPKGRPRKDRNLLKHIEAELDAEMQVMEGGRTLRLTKREALAKLMVNKALQADHKMLLALLKQLPAAKNDDAADHATIPLEAVIRFLTRKDQLPENKEPGEGSDQ